MNTTRFKFDNESNFKDFYTLACIKENEGNLQGAIKDYSLSITYYPRDYSLLFRKGKVLFKLKEYKKAIKDLNEFIKKNLDNPYSNHFEALFLKECCDLILKNPFQTLEDRGYLTLREFKHPSFDVKIYILFLDSLEESLNGAFEKSLDQIQILNNLDSYFLKDQKYLLEHLPKEMKTILHLCWHII